MADSDASPLCKCGHPMTDHIEAIKVAGGWMPTAGLSQDTIEVAKSEGKWRYGCKRCLDWCS